MTTVPNPNKQLTKDDLTAMVLVAKETGSLPVGRKLRIIENPDLRTTFINELRSALSEAEAERSNSGDESKGANTISFNLKKALDEFEGYDLWQKARASGQA